MSRRQPRPAPTPRPTAPPVAAPARFQLDAWLERHAVWLTLLAVLLGLGLRWWTATLTRFSGDEALHYELFHRDGLGLVYSASKTNAHPPLYFLSLYAWHLLGTSELWLRMPAVLLGSLAIWFLARWATLALDARTGVIVAVLAATTPALVQVCAEVRGYGLLLFCLAGTLWSLERALQGGAVRQLWAYAAFFIAAVLTHYSMVWVSAGLGGYALLVLWRRKPARAFVLGWAGIQTVVVLLYVFLWFSHLRHLRGSDMEKEAITSWLSGSYLGDRSSVLTFAWSSTVRLFLWLAIPVGASAEQMPWGTGLLAAALLGVGLAAWRRGPLAALLALTPVVALLAGVLNLFPFGGTRHSTFLTPFLLAAVAVPLGVLARARFWLGLAAAIALAVGWTQAADTMPLDFQRKSLTQPTMTEALDYMRKQIPAGALVFCDMQAVAILRYYLDRGPNIGQIGFDGAYVEQTIGGYRVVTPQVWTFRADRLGAELSQLAKARGLARGTPVWVVDVGMERTLFLDLRAAGSGPFPLAGQAFDYFLSVLQVPVP